MTGTEMIIKALKSDPATLGSATKEVLYGLGFMDKNKNGNSYVTKRGKLFVQFIEESSK